MGSPSYNRGRAHAVRIKWVSLALTVVTLILLLTDVAQGWSFDHSIRLALIATSAFGFVIHCATRLMLAKWFSGSFTDDQDPMRF
jgi:hypothetical protein